MDGMAKDTTDSKSLDIKYEYLYGGFRKTRIFKSKQAC